MLTATSPALSIFLWYLRLQHQKTRALDTIVTSRTIQTIPSDQAGTGFFNPPSIAGAVESVEFEVLVLLAMFASRNGTLNCAAIMACKSSVGFSGPKGSQY